MGHPALWAPPSPGAMGAFRPSRFSLQARAGDSAEAPWRHAPGCRWRPSWPRSFMASMRISRSWAAVNDWLVSDPRDGIRLTTLADTARDALPRGRCLPRLRCQSQSPCETSIVASASWESKAVRGCRARVLCEGSWLGAEPFRGGLDRAPSRTDCGGSSRDAHGNGQRKLHASKRGEWRGEGWARLGRKDGRMRRRGWASEKTRR